MEGVGEEKLYFPLWKSIKHQKAPLGRSVSSVSTNFVADCSFRFGAVNIIIYEWALSHWLKEHLCLIVTNGIILPINQLETG